MLSDARSYAERLFDYREVGALDDMAALDALVIPAQRNGARFAAGAAETIARASAGYPYFLQTYGQAAWEIARDKVVLHMRPWTTAGDQGAVSAALLARAGGALARSGVEHAVAITGT